MSYERPAYLTSNDQRDYSNLYSEMSGSDAEKQLLAWPKVISLRYYVTAWQVNLHTGSGWTNLTNNNEYTSPILVRRFIINRRISQTYYDESIIVFDTPYSTQVEMELKTGIAHEGYITKVYLASSNTNAQTIHLLG